MADDRLRDLEREWRELGGAERERALLVERRRQGLLGPERVVLAAYLGHAGARDLAPQWAEGLPAAATGRETEEQRYTLERERMRALFERWGAEVCVRSALGAAGRAHSLLVEEPQGERAGQALESARRLLEDPAAVPVERHVEVVESVRDDLEGSRNPLQLETQRTAHALSAVMVAAALASAVHFPNPPGSPPVWEVAFDAVVAAVRAVSHDQGRTLVRDFLRAFATSRLERQGWDEVQAASNAALIPWALGLE